MAKLNWGDELRSTAWAVLRRRCPKCRRSGAFTSWFCMRESCPDCGRRFQRLSGSTTGTMQVGALVIPLFAMAVWGVLYLFSGWSLDVNLIVMLVVTTVFGVWVYPYAKLTWEAVDYLIDAAGDEDDHRPAA